MSTPLEKLKRLKAVKQSGSSFSSSSLPGVGQDHIVIVMNKWNIFFVLLFQIILGFLFFGLGFLFCLKTTEVVQQKKEEIRKPLYAKLYVPSSSENKQDRSIVQNMAEYDRR